MADMESNNYGGINRTQGWVTSQCSLTGFEVLVRGFIYFLKSAVLMDLVYVDPDSIASNFAKEQRYMISIGFRGSRGGLTLLATHIHKLTGGVP